MKEGESIRWFRLRAVGEKVHWLLAVKRERSEWLVFNPKSTHFAYVAKLRKEEFIVLNGKPGPKFEKN